MPLVSCPICLQSVLAENINKHLDSGCSIHVAPKGEPSSRLNNIAPKKLAPIFSQSHDKHTSTVADGPLAPPSMTQYTPTTSKKRKLQVSSISSKPSKGTSSNLKSAVPLAERVRPQCLDEFCGQKHLTGPECLLTSMVDSGNIGSLVLWGPPGCGKTTLARLLARNMDCNFRELSATSSGTNDVRAVLEEAKVTLSLTGRKTILFLDEIHRFSKAQQDVFLPYIEKGQIQMIGATTENPSFRLTGALLSRCRVLVLERLTNDDIRGIISSAVERVLTSVPRDCEQPESERAASPAVGAESMTSQNPLFQFQPSQALIGCGGPSLPYTQLTDRVISSIVSLSMGDARTALSLLELVLASKPDRDEHALLALLRQSVSASYDRVGENHYDMISALHKSIRGSHGSAAMYWLARMLTGGEDPLYIARRLVVCASEDIGLADARALPLAMAALQACQVIGMPECRINLAHCVGYLSEAPKCTRAYEAYNRAEVAAKSDLTMPVPMAVRNAPTTLMKELGYAEGYNYNPNFRHPVCNDYLPIAFRGDSFLKEVGDLSDKVWDERELLRWEQEENGGRLWEGRSSAQHRR
ncbi:P-loop containing nucleoside triphosphate hydrolase protein [Suillus bovinus]|uniref:P-loop containing nucleoside triphosphate hydrolase protein n=1 Tax=Suillus bovinus TaxID=48563 RepID=UPI001B85D978|nr:P-loop containing nucleoside triphosphate hydrolase protein [Suillus bovinus]KAG2145962.1 P-loop containing nucleoside triphosphate hydrolase protein [Suillus bovinus]